MKLITLDEVYELYKKSIFKNFIDYVETIKSAGYRII